LAFLSLGLLDFVNLKMGYVEKSTYYEAPLYAVFSDFLLLPLIGTNIFISTLFSNALILGLCSSLKEQTKFPAVIK
jgi:hypothetical protein